MDRVSKPLIGVLIATVAVLALWVVALKPSSSSNGPNGNGGGLGQFQSSINKAHQAVQTSNADNARSGQVPTTTSQLTTAPPTVAPVTGGAGVHSSSSSSSASSAAQPSTTTTPAARAARFAIVKAALDAHKAVALLFYNPPAADDQAVKLELASVPTHRGRVVKVAVPLTELSSYTAVTQQVPVNMSPTLVVIARDGQAGEIAGFTDKVEITQRVADALATGVK
jgi:hypothetical protein